MRKSKVATITISFATSFTFTWCWCFARWGRATMQEFMLLPRDGIWMCRSLRSGTWFGEHGLTY